MLPACTEDQAAEKHAEESHMDHDEFNFMDFFGDENTEDDE